MPDQKRFFEWKSDDSTFDLNTHHLNIFVPGVYRGYRFKRVVDTVFYMEGEATEVQVDGTELTNVSLLVTRQGVVIKESQDIGVIIDSNETQGLRMDAIICTHTYVVQLGGQAAVYSAIKGTADFALPPALINPLTQTLVGYLTVPPMWKGDASDGFVFDRVHSPSLADDPTHARTFLANVFTQLQTVKGIAYLKEEGKLVDTTIRCETSNAASYIHIKTAEMGGNLIHFSDAVLDVENVSIGKPTGRRVYLIARMALKFFTTGNVQTPYNRDWIVQPGNVMELLDVSTLEITGKDWILQPTGFQLNLTGDLVIPVAVDIQGQLHVKNEAYAENGQQLATRAWCSATFRNL